MIATEEESVRRDLSGRGVSRRGEAGSPPPLVEGGGERVSARAFASRALSATIFASLLAILPLSAAPYGSIEPLWVAVFNSAIFLLAALWAAEGALAGAWLRAPRSHALVLPVFALAALSFLQGLSLFGGEAISFDPYESRLVALRILALGFYLAMLLRYADTERRLRALVLTIIAVGVATAFFGIARQTGQRDETGFLFLSLLRRGAGYAQYINKNHFAYIAEMSLGLALGVVIGRGVAKERLLLYVAAALPVWAALVLSGSRGGILAMLCQIIFLASTFGATRAKHLPEAFRAQHDPRSAARSHLSERSRFERLAGTAAARALMVVALILTITVGMIWLGGDSLADRVASVGEEAASVSSDASRTGRKDIWAASLEVFKANPLAGVGFGGYWIAISRYHKGSGASVPQQAHNDYLELLASGGVIGGALVMLFLALLVRASSIRLREASAFERAAAYGALVGLVGIAVHSLVEFGLHVPSNAFAAAALVAVAAGRR